jgi:hypothetical protein
MTNRTQSCGSFGARPPEDCARLAEELRIHSATARVLAARGWNTPALAARFLNPDREDILDPSHLPDFDRAIVRTLQAIRNRESIMIFGDYDVDAPGDSTLRAAFDRLQSEINHCCEEQNLVA